MTNNGPAGPDPATISDHIMATWPETDRVEIPGAMFFSLDAEKHFPNYATIVTDDSNDDASDLERVGIFRLNVGVDRETFERLVGTSIDPETDYAVLDRILPHPVYAAQRWISILNPSPTTWQDVVIPLLAVAHDRLAAQRARHGLD